MALNIGEIVTVVAIPLICIIFAVYIIILRRMGWLGGKSNFYRCPNQQCKKIFQIPIEVKDLSMTPPRTYPACPECGVNIDDFLGSVSERMSKITENTILHRKKIQPKPMEMKNEFRKVDASNPSQNKVMILNKAPETETQIKPIEKKFEKERVEKPIQGQNQTSKVIEKAPKMKPMVDEKMTDMRVDSGCEYYFGYLATCNVKQEGIPAKCLGCPRSIDCLLS